jgi:hypothetical protein
MARKKKKRKPKNPAKTTKGLPAKELKHKMYELAIAANAEEAYRLIPKREIAVSYTHLTLPTTPYV